jgi:hypothetical protein
MARFSARSALPPDRTASEAVEKRFLERTSGLCTGGKPQRLAGL